MVHQRREKVGLLTSRRVAGSMSSSMALVACEAMSWFRFHYRSVAVVLHAHLIHLNLSLQQQQLSSLGSE